MLNDLAMAANDKSLKACNENMQFQSCVQKRLCFAVLKIIFNCIFTLLLKNIILVN